MFKLVAVGGKLRGKEIVLTEGTNTLGRGMDVDHQVSIDGVSKKHFSITVNKDSCFIEDLGSSNGTFVNGKLIKKASVGSKDKIAIPNVIFQLVYVKERKKVIKKKVAKQEDENDVNLEDEIMPKDLVGRVKYIFKNKIMTVVYGFNGQYEWNVLLGIFIFIFICTNIALTIGPVLIDSRRLLVREIVARGTQYADEVARSNRAALKRGNLDQVNVSFLENDAEGVQRYELFDFEGRIVRPLGKLNNYVGDSFSVGALNHFKTVGDENIREAYYKSTDGIIGIGKAILAYDESTGREEPVGIIAIRFKPKSLAAEAANSTSSYLESLIITSFVGIIFFGIIYYMTTRPLIVMRRQAEEVLRGKRKEVELDTLFDEIVPLKNTVNTLLVRIKELQREDGGEFQEVEDDGSYVAMLYEFMVGAQGPTMILDSEKLIKHINTEGEDLTGMRENAAQGTSLLDSARDQGFAATVIDLCDQSASNEGTNQSEVYELTGKNYMINVASVLGKDMFAKAFYVTFVLDE